MVYIYCNDNAGHGVDVIINNLISSLERQNIEVIRVSDITRLNKDSFIIPYSAKLAKEQIEKGFKCPIAFLVDAITLGFKNKVLNYISNFYFCEDLLYCICAYIKYIQVEKKVIEKYQNIMLVSQTDINYLESRYPKQYLYLPNGVDIDIKHYECKKYNGKLTLGILCTGNASVFYDEVDVFVSRYLKKYLIEHKNVECIIAGNGIYNEKFARHKGIKVIGKVNKLEDFYSNIDIFISPVAKGCGVINRVLEAFAFGAFTVGHEGTFTGITDLSKGYLCYTSYQEFENCIDFFLNNPDKVNEYKKNAQYYIKEYRNWDKIYDEFVKSKLIPIIESFYK